MTDLGQLEHCLAAMRRCSYFVAFPRSVVVTSSRPRLCSTLAVALSAALAVGCGVNGGVADLSAEASEVPSGGNSSMATTQSATLVSSSPSTDVQDSAATTAFTTTSNAPSTTAVTSTTLPTSTPPVFEPAPVMLRRLTRTQFRNALDDLLHFDVDIHDLEPDSWDGDFAAIGAAKVVTSERGVEQYNQIIESAVNAVFSEPTTAQEFVGCDPQTDDLCTTSFIARIGRLAWRRALSSEELTPVLAIADATATDFEDAMEGLRWATIALFSSTNFIYRSELGVQEGTAKLRYSGYEMASRLAFLLWNSTPNAELLDAAELGELDTSDGVKNVAVRMLESSAGREVVGAFAEEYMRLDRVGSQAKDPSLFPEYNADLQAAMVRDMRESWQAIVFDDDASAMDLFSSNRAFVNADLASLYGVDASGLDATTFRAVTLPENSPRVGILGKAAFLSQYANQKEGSPTLRGKFIRQSLMCMTVPAPPGNVDLVIDEAPIDMPMTKRERLALHRENDSCANCHAFMDPLGLPLETFDAIGRYRTTELGLTIDPSGEFDGTPVADARELGFAVADSETVANCMVRKFYSYALGFEERTVDRAVVDELTAAFQTSGYKLRELVLAIVGHEAFATAVPQTDSTVTSP